MLEIKRSSILQARFDLMQAQIRLAQIQREMANPEEEEYEVLEHEESRLLWMQERQEEELREALIAPNPAGIPLTPAEQYPYTRLALVYIGDLYNPFIHETRMVGVTREQGVWNVLNGKRRDGLADKFPIPGINSETEALNFAIQGLADRSLHIAIRAVRF